MLIENKEVKLFGNIIVGDEDPKIFRKCLESIRPYVDEILVGWNGHKKETEDLLKEFKCNYFKSTWNDNFQDKRKEVWDKTPDDALVIWLDSDDVLLYGEELIKTCQEVFKFKEGIGIALEWFYSKDPNNPDIIITSLWRERIVRKNAWEWIKFDLHESLHKTREGECFTIDSMKIDHLCPPEKFIASQKRNYEIIKRVYDLEKTSGALRQKTMFDYGRALEGIQKKAEAIEVYKEYIKICDNEINKFSCYGVMSEASISLKKYEDAANYAVAQLITLPHQPDGYINLGGSFYNRKMYKPAIVFLEQSFHFKPLKELPINPTRYDIIPMKLLASAYMMTGKMEEAKKCANYVLTRIKDDATMKKIVAHAEQTLKQIRLIDSIMELKTEVESKRERVKHLLKALPDWAFDHPTIAKWKETHKW